MSSPSQLGSVGNRISLCLPLSTSTARFFVRTSDTGTVATTSRAIDLSRALHVGATGGKPLDVTVHTRMSGPPRWKSVAVAVPFELVYHTSGVNTFVTVAHKTRAATSGAGSTWRTLKTDVYRYKMGTDTDATFHGGLVSDCNLQAVDRFYKTNITLAWRTATSTSAKDTTTNQEMVINSPVFLFSGADSPQVSVPFKVS
jgi:hypothetical protein